MQQEGHLLRMYKIPLAVRWAASLLFPRRCWEDLWPLYRKIYRDLSKKRAVV